MLRRTLAVLLGAVLGGAPAADAAVTFQRADIPLSGAPGSVALGDLDGRNGKDIAVALPATGAVGVLLNNGDGTFGALQPYPAGPQCAGQAVEVELGDVTGPRGPFVPDGKLDAYVTCSPYVVRLTGDGAGALGSPTAFQLYLPPYLGSATIDFLALVRRPTGNPAPLLALQHSVNSFGRQLCISYELDSEALICSATPVEGPLVVGDLNGAFEGVPPDEIFTAVGAGKLGIFGFAPQIPTYFTNSVRTLPGGPESAAVGDLNRDGRLDVLVGQMINSVSARVESIHSLLMGASELAQVPAPLPSIPGLDAVAIADVDGDGCTDVVGAGGYGRGIIHLGDGTGGFDGGQDLPQLGYQNPATTTRVSMAVGDLTGDGLPEIVIADVQARSVMVYANRSTAPGGACHVPPTLPPPVDAVPATGTGAGVVPPSPTPTPAPVVPRTCQQPGTTSFTVGTPGDDVLVGSNSRDVLSGRGGDDCLFGLGGEDVLKGGTGADKLKGSSGDDRLNGDAGDDDLRGDNGNDTITPARARTR